MTLRFTCLLFAILTMLAVVALPCAAPVLAQTADDNWLATQQRGATSLQRGAGSPAPRNSNRINREVLALYDSTQEAAPDRTRIHRYLELPLNHLGLTVTYWDIAAGPPDAETMKRQRGVVTWFGERVANPGAYLDWATRQAVSGTRFVVLDFVGSPLNPDDLPKVNAFLKSLGLEMAPRWVGTAEAGAIVTRDAGMVEFEAKLGAELPGYMVMEAKGGAVKTHLALQSRNTKLAPQARSALIVTGPGGGFAAVGYVRHYDPATRRLSWMLNPFAFLTAALALEQAPIPDTTTVGGRRLYFSHVDGEGWNTTSKVAAASGEAGESAAEVVRRELIEPYADLPVAVGLIAADADPTLGGTERAAQSARRMFALPQVEVASNTHTHPFRWPFFAAYDRDLELGIVYARRASALRNGERERSVLARFATRDYAMRSERAFQAYGSGMPRARMHRAFDLDTEVAGALAVVKQLAPADKPAGLYLWSGDARPFEAAIRAARAAGARGLNGGDARLDDDFPSLMYVPPTARPVGRERQIYAVNSSETTYTNGWRGPFDGQAKLSETWSNTDAPRRLKGMNLYYHMYSGERPESVGALKHLLDIVRKANVTPVSAAHYAAIADSFYDVEMIRLGQLKWRVTNRGALQTVRFDDAASLYVDMRQSQGVLGFTHHAKSLYVALDEAVPEAVVALTSSKPDPKRQERPYLIDSRWMISKLKVGTCGFEADAQGYGTGEMHWAGVRPGAYAVSLVSEHTDVEAITEAMVDQSGELKVAVHGNAVPGGRLKVACTRNSPLRTGTVTR